MIGKVISNYQITHELALGGMGAVYRARHLHLPREVVIKSILLDSFSASAQEHLKARFRREACIQSQLDHPNIVRVYEFFETRENYYLVMEYVSGVSLRDLLDKQGPPAPSQAVYLFKQVLSALDYAHNFSYLDETNNRYKGIIHRDINPANLLLDVNGRVKITDFGTVKLSGGNRLTQHGFHPGTIEYMSPEQLRGIEIDARSDIYSVGVTFYEMLTGQLPFPRSDDGSDWEVRKGHIELTPPSITGLNPDVPEELAEIVMRSLEKNPDQRYRTAGEFLNAIRLFKRRFEDGQRKSLSRKSRRKIASGGFSPAQTVIKPDLNVFRDEIGDQLDITGSITIPINPGELSGRPVSHKTSPNFLRSMTDAKIKANSSVKVTAANKKSGIGVQKSMKMNKWVLNAAVLALLLGLSVIGIFQLSQESGQENLQTAMTKPGKVDREKVSKEVAGIMSSDGLRAAFLKAGELEKQEKYDEAVEAYEAILWRDSKVEGARDIHFKISEIRRFQALMQAAAMAANGNRLSAAWRYYSEALQVMPESKLAKAGLTEIENKMALAQR